MSKDLWGAVQQAPPGTKFVEKTIGFVVPRNLIDETHQEDERGDSQVVEVVPCHSYTPSYVHQGIASSEIACDQGEETRLHTQKHEVTKNRRLKLGLIKLPSRQPVCCLETGEVFERNMDKEDVLRLFRSFSEDLKVVIRSIIELDAHEFWRSDLTRALKNKMKAQEIKGHLEQLVRKDLLKKTHGPSSVGEKGGRPKTEQYQIQFDKDTIQLTDLDVEL
nr:hypothetical protein [uncultured Pseudodesulfovibrio sp.]